MGNIATVINGAFWLYKVEVFKTKTVDEIVSGYEDPLLKMAQFFDKTIKDSKFSILNGVIILL